MATTMLGCRWTRGATGDLLMIEARRFKRVLDALDHLDDSLLALLAVGGVSDKAEVPAGLGYMFWLGSLDANVVLLLECHPSAVGGCLNLLGRASLHLPSGVIRIDSMGKWG